jgi:hypothetical protein
MEDKRGIRWATFLAPVLLILLTVIPARADLLVHRLNGNVQTGDSAATPCCVTGECAAITEENAVDSKKMTEADASQLPLLVLATVLFSNPDDTTPPGTSTGGGTTTTSGGGSNPPPTSHAPEPATVISALVGMSLAGIYTALRRKRLVASAN